ncbi:hypothetical protein D3C76_728560 [compost metagenome]
MSEILTAALSQNPIDFKAKFDEALKAAVLAKAGEVQVALTEAFGKKEDDKEDKDKKDDKSDDEKDEKSDKGDDEKKDEDDDEDDDSKKSNLTERTLSFEVGNPSSASKQLRSKGVAAASEPGDGKVVKVKVATPDDGRKVAAWLADQGWSDKDIKQKYPELSRLSKQKG